jgi:hypothetical protein
MLILIIKLIEILQELNKENIYIKKNKNYVLLKKLNIQFFMNSEINRKIKNETNDIFYFCNLLLLTSFKTK